MKYIFTAVLLICFYPLFSQQFTTITSEKLDYHGSLDIISTGNGYIAMDIDANTQLLYTYKLNKAKHKINLLKYDKKMEMVKKTQLSGGDKVYGPFAPVFIKLNDKVCLFYYQFAEEKETIEIFHTIINAEQLEISQPQKILSIEQKNVGFFKAEDVASDYKFIIEQSPDHSKTLVLWCSGQNNRIFYSVLDSSMNILRSKTETINGTNKFILGNACIDNGGNIYAGYNADKVFIGSARSESKTLTIQLINGQPEQVFVSPGSGYEFVYIGGVYKGTNEEHAGAFLQSLNTNNFSLSQATKSSFPAGMKEKIYEQLRKYYPEKEKWIYSKIIFTPVITGNGHLHLLGRSVRTINSSTPTNNGMTQRNGWGSFIYIRLDTSSAVFIRIPKVTRMADSYYYSIFKNQVLLFYNDIDKDLKQDITENEEPRDGEYVPFVAVISTDGSMKREIIPAKGAIVNYTQQLTPSSLLIPTSTGYTINSLGGQIELTRKSDFYWTTINIK